MDEHGLPTSSSDPPSPASFFSAAGNGPVLEFPYTEVPENWLIEDDGLREHGAVWEDRASLSPGSAADLSSRNPPAAAATKRGRKPGGSSAASGGAPAAVSHVEAERHRRDKLHRRFCDLRAAVPNVTRMDKASLLADATTYIADLRARVEQLELEAARAAARKKNPFFVVDDAGASAAAAPAPPPLPSSLELEENEEEKLEVRMLAGQDAAAALRLTTAARHAPARLMNALRSLDLPVQHACACRVGGVTVQDAVVGVPPELRDERFLRAALLHRLQQYGG